MNKNSAPSFQWQWLHPRYTLTWLGLGILFGIAFLPWKIRYQLGQFLGGLLFKHHAKRQHIVQTNIKLCFPKLTQPQQIQLAKESLQNYASAMLDYSVLFFRRRGWLYQRTQLHTSTSFQKAVKNKEPIILFLAHSSWLEFAPLAVGKHYQSYGSYKPFKNPILDWLIAKSRLKDVEFVIAREEGMLRLARSLTNERMMIFLPDEDHGEKHSVYAPFMGRTKATLSTASRLAKLGKAHCFPVFPYFDNTTGYYKVVINEALENYPSKNLVNDATTLNQALEQLIKQYPADYMWLLKLFKTQPEGLKVYD